MSLTTRLSAFASSILVLSGGLVVFTPQPGMAGWKHHQPHHPQRVVDEEAKEKEVPPAFDPDNEDEHDPHPAPEVGDEGHNPPRSDREDGKKKTRKNRRPRRTVKTGDSRAESTSHGGKGGDGGKAEQNLRVGDTTLSGGSPEATATATGAPQSQTLREGDKTFSQGDQRQGDDSSRSSVVINDEGDFSYSPGVTQLGNTATGDCVAIFRKGDVYLNASGPMKRTGGFVFSANGGAASGGFAGVSGGVNQKVEGYSLQDCKDNQKPVVDAMTTLAEKLKGATIQDLRSPGVRVYNINTQNGSVPVAVPQIPEVYDKGLQ